MSDGRNIILYGTVILLSSFVAGNGDYCKIRCEGGPHTMCKYKAGGGPQCQEYTSGLTEYEKREIVKMHNELRHKVASGKEKRGKPGPQPPAANMHMLSWDKEMAKIAQRWADQCTEKGHDKCRSSLHGDYVGQNIAWASGHDSAGCHKDDLTSEIKGMIKGWFKEVTDVDHRIVDSFKSDGKKPIGHYTQMVWAETTHIGCGATYLCDGSEHELKLVCNYIPGGNIIKGSIYHKGTSCTNCPEGSHCSSKRPGLCMHF